MFKKIMQGAVMALSLMAAGAALAQWQWVDESGKKVYSDRPPPITVPESNILKSPKGAPSAPTPRVVEPAAQAGSESPEQALAPKQAESVQEDAELKVKAEQLKNKEAEASSKESAEVAQKNAQIEKDNAAARQRNCTNARNRLAQLEPGKRVMTTGADGAVGFMDDKTRAAEHKTAQEMMQANCR
ncbi:DUF4124 domain-containing protein [Lampropedia puyangensis]|nr:DUF4124 domain-containing protein [Lampropedia puyangensis]